MRLIFLTCVSFLFLFSCKKEEVNNFGANADSEYFQSKPGSYWVYEWFLIDSNNIETTLSIIDTVFVTGDTLINNKTYAIFKNSFLGNPTSEIYKRDSSGYIIDLNGSILYSYLNFTDTLSTSSELGFWDTYSLMIHPNNLVNVPVGSFSCIKHEIVHFDPIGNPVTSCGDLSFNSGAYYAKNIGEIKTKTGFFGEIQALCRYRERRLVSFYIP